MNYRNVGLCVCGHVKSIHKGFGSKAGTTKAKHPCNFPDCKCRNYRKIGRRRKQK